MDTLVVPYLFKSYTSRIVIRCSCEGGPQRPSGVVEAANRAEGSGEISEIFGVCRRDLHRNLELREGIGKATLLAINRAKIAVQ